VVLPGQSPRSAGLRVPSCSAGRRGFTLVEAVIALVVLAAAATGIMALCAQTAGSADPMLREQARAVASSYVDEIFLRRFGSGPGDCGQSARENFETIWCYDGLDEAPRNQFGDPITDLSDYRVTVRVSGDADAATIAVRVTHDSGRVDYRLESRRASI